MDGMCVLYVSFANNNSSISYILLLIDAITHLAVSITEPPPIDLRPAEPVARESSTSTIDRDALAEQAGAERRRENTTSVIDRDALRDDDQPGDEAKSPAPLRASKATSGD